MTKYKSRGISAQIEIGACNLFVFFVHLFEMDDNTPKRAAQDICRICAIDLSQRSIARFNLFRGDPPLAISVQQCLQLEDTISRDDELPECICKPYKTSIDAVIKAQLTQKQLQTKYATVSGQVRKKRLAKPPAYKKADQEDIKQKSAALDTGPFSEAPKPTFTPQLVAAPPSQHLPLVQQTEMTANTKERQEDIKRKSVASATLSEE